MLDVFRLGIFTVSTLGSEIRGNLDFILFPISSSGSVGESD